MRKETKILNNDDILAILSTEHPNFYSVFIKPYSIVIPNDDIINLNLKCSENDINSEEIILEIYDDEKESKERVDNFTGSYIDYYYVACYKNKKLIWENQ